MRQLSEQESALLNADNPRANANLSYLLIYDQGTAPGAKLRFKSILAHIESRLDRSPLFRSRLQRVPFELDCPYWVDDEHFDLEYHVRHIALPKPGDWRQFCIQVSRIHARSLDLNRPPWEIYVIEGLDSFIDLPAGSFALLVKLHQAALGGRRRSEIVDLLHDLRPEPLPGPPPAPWFAGSAPDALDLMARSAWHLAFSPLRWFGPVLRVAQASQAFAADLLHPEPNTATRFNAVVSPHRVFDTRRFLREEVERIAALVPGARIEDALAAVCAGGLRSYLDAQGELPDHDLQARVEGVPGAIDAPTRMDPGEGESTSRGLHLGTNLADPIERLAALVAQQGAAAATPRWAACTLAELPGPDEPQFLLGARMTYFSAILPIADGQGLVFAVSAYDGRIIVSPTSCRELLPDPEAFTQCLRDSFQEYLALADLRPAAPRASAPGRRRRAAPKARKAATALAAAPGARPRSTARPR
ncbi:MAG: DUF1298 domain-containing protein [Burkholderiales bacterium]|nr:DUF1298 domain-containing protein [Burkholderiales bacterium]